MNCLFSKCGQSIEFANKTKGFGCFYSSVETPDNSVHLHDTCEIFFCIKGGKTFFIDDKIYDVASGDIFVINQFEPHKITPQGDEIFERYVFQIHPAFLYDFSTVSSDLSQCFNIRNKNISNRLSPSREEYEKLLSIVRRLETSSGFGDDIFKRLAAVEFITNVNILFNEQNLKSMAAKVSDSDKNAAFLRAVSYINDNFASPLSLESVAKNCYTSVSSLCRLFKIYMNTTVTRYIISRRITEAKRMLSRGESVSVVQEKCGFSDYANFIRTFKSIVGVPPGKYKKNCRD